MPTHRGLVLHINTANAAFDEGNLATELARLLRHAADKIEWQGKPPTLHENLKDINGNVVGTFVHADIVRLAQTERYHE